MLPSTHFGFERQTSYRPACRGYDRATKDHFNGTGRIFSHLELRRNWLTVEIFPRQLIPPRRFVLVNRTVFDQPEVYIPSIRPIYRAEFFKARGKERERWGKRRKLSPKGVNLLCCKQTCERVGGAGGRRARGRNR